MRAGNESHCLVVGDGSTEPRRDQRRKQRRKLRTEEGMQGWRGRAQTRHQRQDQKVRAGRLERERGCARVSGPPMGEVDALLHQVCLVDDKPGGHAVYFS
jgi:hypothetical protein